MYLALLLLDAWDPVRPRLDMLQPSKLKLDSVAHVTVSLVT